MRTRKEIEAEDIYYDRIFRRVTLEIQLDIRELLMNPPVEITHTPVSDKVAQQALKEDYERNWSHTHCWNQEDPPACGISLEKHAQCCLCDTQVPRKDSVEEGTV